MLPSEELKILHDKQLRTTEEEVMNLFADFIKKSPVDTGAFRTAWSIDKKLDGSWVITNDVNYATILFNGTDVVAGKRYGSEQWPDGGYVMIEKFNRTLQRKLDKVKI